MANLTLYELTAEQQHIEDLLIENGGELTPELEAALAENATALAAKVDGYQHIIARLGMIAEASKKEKDRFAERQKVAENSVKRIREHLARTMQEQGISKLEGDTCKVSLRRSEAVDIYDEPTLIGPYTAQIAAFNETLPAWCKLDVKVDKTALKAAILGGEPFAGAGIVENFSAIVK